MRGTRRLALARETLTELSTADLSGVAAGATEPTQGDRCRDLSVHPDCVPSLDPLRCLRTVGDRTCGCAGGA